ncbi:MAG: hypothetical protein ACRCWQ_06845 [Bacilli bacterium]
MPVIIKVEGINMYLCLFHGKDTLLVRGDRLGNKTYQTVMQREVAEDVVKFIREQKVTRVDKYKPKPFHMNFYTLTSLKKYELIIEETDKQLSLF